MHQSKSHINNWKFQQIRSTYLFSNCIRNGHNKTCLINSHEIKPNTDLISATVNSAFNSWSCCCHAPRFIIGVHEPGVAILAMSNKAVEMDEEIAILRHWKRTYTIITISINTIAFNMSIYVAFWSILFVNILLATKITQYVEHHIHVYNNASARCKQPSRESFLPRIDSLF